MDITKGIDIQPKFVPPLDPGFKPASLINRRFRELAAKNGVPLRLSLERADGSISTFDTIAFAPGDPRFELNLPYAERIVKFLLWQRGGWKVTVGGPAAIGEYIKQCYQVGGTREFDSNFMGGVYEHPFTVVVTEADKVPAEKETSSPLGRHMDGCRIGFDLGGSDRKFAAVQDGKVLVADEIKWDPYHQPDPEYHRAGILDCIQQAAKHLPRIDAIGGSAAGVYVNNRVRVASLFRGVMNASKELFDAKVVEMFIEIGKELGVPLEVVNDGEVTALAGSMSLGENPVLGIAMGTSLAAGYVNKDGNITGWLNELAFTPIDYRPAVTPHDPIDYSVDGPIDEWSGDTGCGVQYFSQQGVNRLALQSGIRFDADMKLPDRLVRVQEMMAAGDPTAAKLYESIGIFLGYAMAHYADFYELSHTLILGRVTTGKGGDIIVSKATEVLNTEFEELSGRVKIATPDEKARRVGQSIAAASLPEIKK
jgi:predicted NBD/HSP70 family sugar kinase